MRQIHRLADDRFEDDLGLFEDDFKFFKGGFLSKNIASDLWGRC